MFSTLNTSSGSTTTIEQPCLSPTTAALSSPPPPLPSLSPKALKHSVPIVDSCPLASSNAISLSIMPSNQSLSSLTDKLSLSNEASKQPSNGKAASSTLPIVPNSELLSQSSSQPNSVSDSAENTSHLDMPSTSNSSLPQDLPPSNSSSLPSASTSRSTPRSASSSVTSNDLRKLLKLFSRTSYKPQKVTHNKVEDRCIGLFLRDYPSHVILTNLKGELCRSYPAKMFIPETDDFLPNLSFYPDAEAITSTLRANSVSVAEYYYNGNHYSPASSANLENLVNSSGTGVPFAFCGRNDVGKLDASRIKDFLLKARLARCRTRFPIPVIVYRNRYICRSSTLSGGAELVGRSFLDYCTQTGQAIPQSFECPNAEYSDDEFVEAVVIESPPKNFPKNNENLGKWPRPYDDFPENGNLFTQARGRDIAFLKFFNVRSICDLMLEMKKVKFGVVVTSSEKTDKESRYSNFNIFQLPYPGCEFFSEFRDSNYVGEGLVYEWNQAFVDSFFSSPMFDNEELKKTMNVDFDRYRHWDIIKLTQNYLKLILKILRDNDSSILVHCISGWDRTPLFISLLRLSLWADGEIHRSLSAHEITYLTLAYDWYLFGHNLSDRISKGEEILFFCFQFLKYIVDDEYSVNHLPPLADINLSNFISPPKQKPSNGESKQRLYVPQVREVRCRTRNDSIDSADKNEYVIADILDSSSPSSFYNPPPPPTLFTCDPNRGDRLFDNPDFDPAVLADLRATPEPCLSSSILILSDADFEESDLAKSSDSGKDEMTSTLTEEVKEDYFAKTESSPVNIPISNSARRFSGFCMKTEFNSNPTDSSGSFGDSKSLNRNDSWQVVSDAGSIRDNFLLNQFSSPDSLSNHSPKRESYLTDSPQFSRYHFDHPSNGASTSGTNQSSKLSIPYTPIHQRQLERKNKLLEVRSIFNAVYTSLNFSQNNGRNASNIVENIVSPFYSSASKDDSP